MWKCWDSMCAFLSAEAPGQGKLKERLALGQHLPLWASYSCPRNTWKLVKNVDLPIPWAHPPPRPSSSDWWQVGICTSDRLRGGFQPQWLQHI